MELWTEMRTAMTVARLGTVSGAADFLRIHRATVSRHIEALEEAIGTALFLRHGRGYTLTEAGADMLEASSEAEARFKAFEGRAKERRQGIYGELIISAVAPIAPLILPAIEQYIVQQPQVQVQFLATNAFSELKFGEAHVAIRGGPKPQDPDYVVLPFTHLQLGLYGHTSYLSAMGRHEDWRAHRFVIATNFPRRSLIHDWIDRHVHPDQIALKTNDPSAALAAVQAGIGLGWLMSFEGERHSDLSPLIAPRDAFEDPLWFVTHRDLHRTAKIQGFKKLLLN